MTNCVFRKTDVSATFTGFKSHFAALSHKGLTGALDATNARAAKLVKSPAAADARRLKRAPLTLSITRRRAAVFTAHTKSACVCRAGFHLGRDAEPIRPWQIELKGQHAKWGRRGGRRGPRWAGGGVFSFHFKAPAALSQVAIKPAPRCSLLLKQWVFN